MVNGSSEQAQSHGINFEPMPKRFKVWEGSQGRFRGEILPGNVRRTIYTLEDLLDWYDGDDIVNLAIVQSTGHRDRNGVEIFEGDILRDAEGYLSVVQYQYGDYDCVDPKDNCVVDSLVDVACDSEVLANVLERPELLKEK